MKVSQPVRASGCKRAERVGNERAVCGKLISNRSCFVSLPPIVEGVGSSGRKLDLVDREAMWGEVVVSRSGGVKRRAPAGSRIICRDPKRWRSWDQLNFRFRFESNVTFSASLHHNARVGIGEGVERGVGKRGIR